MSRALRILVIALAALVLVQWWSSRQELTPEPAPGHAESSARLPSAPGYPDFLPPEALDTLQADTVIANWEYARWDESVTERRGWADEWLLATVRIEAPDSIKDYYDRLGGERAGTIEAAPPRPGLSIQIGERIKRRRKELDLSQLQASEQLEIQQGYLSKLERGLATPSTKLIQKIESWLAG